MQTNIIFTSSAFVFFFLEQYSGSISPVFTLIRRQGGREFTRTLKICKSKYFSSHLSSLAFFIDKPTFPTGKFEIKIFHQNDIFKIKYVSLRGRELRGQRGKIETSAGMCRFHLSFFYGNPCLYTTAQRDYVFNSIIISGISQGPNQKSPC